MLEKAGRWARLLADHAPKLPYYSFSWWDRKLEAVKNEFIMLRKREEERKQEEERKKEVVNRDG